MRVTLKTVNEKLADLGTKAELAKGRGVLPVPRWRGRRVDRPDRAGADHRQSDDGTVGQRIQAAEDSQRRHHEGC